MMTQSHEKLDVVVGVKYVPVADWPPTSVAVTVVPDVPLGSLNVQLNVPEPFVMSEELPVQLELGIVTPSKISPTMLLSEKPVPDTVTVGFPGVSAGPTVIAGVVSVKVLVAC